MALGRSAHGKKPTHRKRGMRTAPCRADGPEDFNHSLFSWQPLERSGQYLALPSAQHEGLHGKSRMNDISRTTHTFVVAAIFWILEV